jgi:hypothetical protein
MHPAKWYHCMILIILIPCFAIFTIFYQIVNILLWLIFAPMLKATFTKR